MIDIGLLIDLYIFKKKTNKQKQNKKIMCQNQWLKREINPLTNKETNKNKNKKTTIKREMTI